MTQVVVQPARNSVARKNYTRTVENPISLEEIEALVDPGDFEVLREMHPSGYVPLWGTTEGERKQLLSRWNRIESGATVLFTGGGEIFKTTTLTHHFRSKALADTLWDPKTTANGKRQSWELLYAFNDPVDVEVSYSTIRAGLPTGHSFPTREFNVLPPDTSARVQGALRDFEALPVPIPDREAAEAITRAFDDLEREATVRVRTEQAYLRQFLLGGASGYCALCGERLPKELLVAAHIKKRALCTTEEKSDIPAIAMLACRFGCDELFERGMVVVEKGGRIKSTRHLPEGFPRAYFESRLKGRSVRDWDRIKQSHKYFEAHRRRSQAAR